MFSYVTCFVRHAQLDSTCSCNTLIIFVCEVWCILINRILVWHAFIHCSTVNLCWCFSCILLNVKTQNLISSRDKYVTCYVTDCNAFYSSMQQCVSAWWSEELWATSLLSRISSALLLDRWMWLSQWPVILTACNELKLKRERGSRCGVKMCRGSNSISNSNPSVPAMACLVTKQVFESQKTDQHCMKKTIKTKENSLKMTQKLLLCKWPTP